LPRFYNATVISKDTFSIGGKREGLSLPPLFLLLLRLFCFSSESVSQAISGWWRPCEALLEGVPAEFQRTWEYRHGRNLYRRKSRSLPGTDGRCMAISADGKRIVSTRAGAGTAVEVWDADTGQILFTLKGQGEQDQQGDD
jgi:hypothetical protein